MKRRVTWIPWVFFGLGLVAVLASIWISMTHALPFDQAAWQSADGYEYFDDRWRMRASVLSLLEQGAVQDKSDADRLFGIGQRGDLNTAFRSHYRLAPQSWLIDSWWLRLQFDEDGSLLSFGVYPD